MGVISSLYAFSRATNLDEPPMATVQNDLLASSPLQSAADVCLLINQAAAEMYGLQHDILAVEQPDSDTLVIAITSSNIPDLRFFEAGFRLQETVDGYVAQTFEKAGDPAPFRNDADERPVMALVHFGQWLGRNIHDSRGLIYEAARKLPPVDRPARPGSRVF